MVGLHRSKNYLSVELQPWVRVCQRCGIPLLKIEKCGTLVLLNLEKGRKRRSLSLPDERVEHSGGLESDALIKSDGAIICFGHG
jgi:hypothetical protein